MHTFVRTSLSLGLLLLIRIDAGLAATLSEFDPPGLRQSPEASPAPVTPPANGGSGTSYLFGDLSTIGCDLNQRQALTTSHQAGMRISMTEAFDACLVRRMYQFYMPCNGESYAQSERATQYTKARDIMRSGNTADVTVTCQNLPDGTLGNAQHGNYGDGHEQINLDRGYINSILVNGGSDWRRADLAGVIWHEAMHQQNYRHDSCGYPDDQYSRGSNSIPYFADRCMRSAGILGRVIVTSADGRSASLGVGRHLASQGHLDGIGDNSIKTMIPGPAMRVRYCRNEGSDGSGQGCNTIESLTPEYGSGHTVPADFENSISFVEVQPLVLLFSETNYRGSVQALGYGEHRANTGGFSNVGNDHTASIYIAPGARVRVCLHEGGQSGHGVNPCRFYEHSVPESVLPGGISYAEVLPVVTAFRGTDLYGINASFSAGGFVGAAGLGLVGNNTIASLVVPDGLTARVCSDAGTSNQGTGGCQTHHRTVFDLAGGLAHTVSFLEVTPPLLGLARLTVQRSHLSLPGSVMSVPLGISCATDCSAEFALRSEVRLTGYAPGTRVKWTGCDRVAGEVCFVTMMAERTVSVKFESLPVYDTCFRPCRDSCIAEGQTQTSKCIQQCRAECGLTD